jgi:DNA polymerase-1
MLSMKSPILAVFDGNWLLHRAYSVLGQNTNNPWKRIPRLLLTFVCRDALHLKASHLALCFDGPNVFRYKLYPRYKENRLNKSEGSNREEDLSQSSPYEYLLPTMERLTELGVYCLQLEEYEADDLLASFAHIFSPSCQDIYLVSRDKDVMGSVKDNVRFYTPSVQQQPALLLDTSGVHKTWGLTPSQLRDYQTLIGDAGDSIPPVLGMADKKARKLIAEHGSLVSFFKTPPGKEFWNAHREDLLRNRALVTMRKDTLPKTLTLDHLKLRHIKDSELPDAKYVPRSYFELREMVYPRTRSLFGR